MSIPWLLPMLALVKLSAANDESGWATMTAGRNYRIDGELVSRGAVDTVELRKKMQFVGARDVVISQRAPHRLSWTMTNKAEFRIKLHSVLPFAEGVNIRIHRVRLLAGGSAVVGRRR